MASVWWVDLGGVLFWISSADFSHVSCQPPHFPGRWALGCAEQWARPAARASAGSHAAKYSDTRLHRTLCSGCSVAMVFDCTAHHHTANFPALAENCLHPADCMHSPRPGFARRMGWLASSCESTFLDLHAGGYGVAVLSERPDQRRSHVRPDPIVKSIRTLYWTWKSRARDGRPPTNHEVRALIRKMSLAKPRWGAPRIHGELLKLGIDIGETTVAKYMTRPRRPSSQTWKTFLKNHMREIVSTDFFVVPTATFRLLFVFLILSHDRRRIAHFAVTAHPTAEWTAQQLIAAFPWDTPPRYLLRDRDGSYGGSFPQIAQAMQIQEVLTAPRSPWQNVYVER